MSKKVCIISSSLRQGGNSDLLADEFAKGALEAGHQVEKISLANRQIGFCKGCLACQKTHRCVISDDATVIVEKMVKSDVLVFATPIYFYEMCGQMKTLLDRTNPAFPADYAFRDIYLIASAADNDPSAMDGAIKGLQGWIDCFDKTRLSGVVYGVGVTAVGEAQNTPQLLGEAYKMGKGLA